MIVDSHVHVWSADPAVYPWQPLLAHVPPPQVPAPVERLIIDMDRAHVDMAILVQPSVYGKDHRYLLDCLKAAPDRFIGVCLIDMNSTTPQNDLLMLCEEGPCRGLRLNTIRQGDITRLTGPDYEGLFNSVAELGLSTAFHMDIEQAPVVARLAARHACVPFIIDYLGPQIHARTDIEAYLDLLAERPNVYFKILCTAEDAHAAYPFPDIIAFYQAVLARFGAGRLIFGSDYPGAASVCTYEKLIAWGQHFPGLSDTDRELVMGKTAQRVFRAD